MLHADLPQIGLWNQHVAHGQHAKATQLFGSVKDYRREATGHFGVKADLDTRLDLVLTLDQEIQELLGIDNCFTEVRHEADQSCVPFVHNLEVKKGKNRVSIG